MEGQLTALPMSIPNAIWAELKKHAPFTLAGAFTGVAVGLLCCGLPFSISHTAFYVLHPIHVVLSALVTASLYRLHRYGRRRFRGQLGAILVIGYVGSIGIATLSDSIIPFLAETLLQLPERAIHLGFIEKWWLVNPLAILGVALAYFRPATRFPHAGHVLLSTWASVFHILMSAGGEFGVGAWLVAFVFLFLAVWVPCCISDIVFPLLFAGNGEGSPGAGDIGPGHTHGRVGK